MSLTALQILHRDKVNAAAFAERAGKTHTRRLLERAQLELNQRLARAEGLGGPGKDSFTASQMRAALAQVRAVLVPLQHGIQAAALDIGKDSAEQGAGDTVEYIRRAEQEYRGSARPLPFDTAAMVDQAVRGSNASVLRRLSGDPANPARPGILQRYGTNTIGLFEQAMQQRLVQGKSWAEARQDLVDASPFLQGKPAFWSERILRTESMFQHNAAGQQSLQQVHDAVGGMLKVLCATFDHRTGSDSIAVHGQVRRVSEAFQSWFGPYMHPPNRPNDREVVVPHNVAWPLPDALKPRSDAEVASRWALEGRTGSPPPRPLMSTISPDDQIQQADQQPPMVDQLEGQPPVGAPEPGQAPEASPTYSFPSPVDQPAEEGSYGPFEVRNPRYVVAHTHALFGRNLDGRDYQQLLGTMNELPGTKPEASLGSSSMAKVITASVRWVDAEGRTQAELARSFRPGVDGKVAVKHSLFVVDDAHKGNGFGSKVLADQLESYPKLGVSKVSLDAAWDGPYVWSRAGFHVADEGQWAAMQQRFSDYLRSKIPFQQAENIVANVRTAKDIALTTHAGAKLGKDFLRSYQASFDTLPHMELVVGTPAYDEALEYFRKRGNK